MILKNVLEAKPWLCFFFLVVFSGTALAQDPFMLKGMVTNENGEALPAALVYDLSNPDVNATANAEGNFRLETIYAIDSLAVSFVGHDLLILKADYSSNMNLKLASVQLENPIVISPNLISHPPQYYPPLDDGDVIIDFLKINPIGIAYIQERGFMQNPLGSSVYPVSEIGVKELESTNNFSVQDALNQIPGVKMDSRGYNGSRRLSLRGTIARSPFGVRNVRMKVNGFPITSSDGSSALELIEPADILSMTIYKGPSGSYEMTGTGGVISTKLKSAFKPVAARAELTYGDFDFVRTHFSVGIAKRKVSARISGVYSSNSGYRKLSLIHI